MVRRVPQRDAFHTSALQLVPWARLGPPGDPAKWRDGSTARVQHTGKAGTCILREPKASAATLEAASEYCIICYPAVAASSLHHQAKAYTSVKTWLHICRGTKAASNKFNDSPTSQKY